MALHEANQRLRGPQRCGAPPASRRHRQPGRPPPVGRGGGERHPHQDGLQERYHRLQRVGLPTARRIDARRPRAADAGRGAERRRHHPGQRREGRLPHAQRQGFLQGQEQGDAREPADVCRGEREGVSQVDREERVARA